MHVQPENVLLVDDHRDAALKVTGFGAVSSPLSRDAAVEMPVTSPRALAAWASYAAPEALDGVRSRYAACTRQYHVAEAVCVAGWVTCGPWA